MGFAVVRKYADQRPQIQLLNLKIESYSFKSNLYGANRVAKTIQMAI